MIWMSGLVILGAASVVWGVLGRYRFVIVLSQGQVTVIKGHVPESFLAICEKVADYTPEKRYVLIRGDQHLGQVYLKISSRVEEPIRQLLRHSFPYSAYGRGRFNWDVPPIR